MAMAKQLSFNIFGTTFNENVTLEEAFEKAGLNFNVEEERLIKVPQEVLDAIKNEEPIMWLPTADDIVKSHKATFRTDANRILGIVGTDYQIVPNNKAFDFINFIGECSGEQPQIVSAGALGYGERIFVCAQLGEDSYLSADDAVKNYVVFTTSHDGSGAVSALFTPIRVVCQNTLNMALRQCPNKVIFKHTKNVGNRLDWSVEENRKKAFEVFSKSVKFSQSFIEAMLNLKEQKVTTDFVTDFSAKMFLNEKQFDLLKKANGQFDKVEEISTRAKNQIEALANAIDFGVGQDLYRGTKLWLLNGVTTYLHNEKNWKSAEDEYRSIMEGDGLRKTQKAYELLQVA